MNESETRLMKSVAEFLSNASKALKDSPYPTGGLSDNCLYFKRKIEEALGGVSYERRDH